MFANVEIFARNQIPREIFCCVSVFLLITLALKAREGGIPINEWNHIYPKQMGRAHLSGSLCSTISLSGLWMMSKCFLALKVSIDFYIISFV